MRKVCKEPEMGVTHPQGRERQALPALEIGKHLNLTKPLPAPAEGLFVSEGLMEQLTVS